MTSLEEIHQILEIGETRNTEFKRSLTREDLKQERKEKLITRIKYMTCETPFEGRFLIGIEDINDKEWRIYGLPLETLKNAEKVLTEICEEADIDIIEQERIKSDKGYIGIYLLKRLADVEIKETCSINVAGRVNSGKSTLVGCLVTGATDDGSGKARSFLLKHPQEITRGQTADIHLAFMGFTSEGQVIHLENPLDKAETARALDKSTRIVTFFDAPGHKEYSKTMIRSILGADAQYGLILIPGPEEANLIRAEEERSGIRRLDDITREHLILMSSQNTPFIVAISKTDKTKPDDLDLVYLVLRESLREIGRISVNLTNNHEIAPIMREIGHGVIVPIVQVAATEEKSLCLLTEFFLHLPLDPRNSDITKPAKAYVDKVYRGIRGTNVVITGTVNQGVFKEGQTVLVGPDTVGKVLQGRLFSIEMFKKRIKRVKTGDLFGFDVKNIDKHMVRRGQLVSDTDYEIQYCKVFEANIIVTRHPTRISVGYTPVLQCHTIQQAVVLRQIYDAEYLSVGDFARVRLEFLSYPEPIEVGSKIVLREANTRAIGTVVEIIR